MHSAQKNSQVCSSCTFLCSHIRCATLLLASYLFIADSRSVFSLCERQAARLLSTVMTHLLSAVSLQAPDSASHMDAETSAMSRLSQLKKFLLSESDARAATYTPPAISLQLKDDVSIAPARPITCLCREFRPSQGSPRKHRPRNVPTLNLAAYTEGEGADSDDASKQRVPVSEASSRERDQTSARRAKTVGLPLPLLQSAWQHDILDIPLRQLKTAHATLEPPPTEARRRRMLFATATPRADSCMHAGYRHPYGAEFSSNTSRNQRAIVSSVSGLTQVVAFAPLATPRSFAAAQIVARFRSVHPYISNARALLS
jgi:hypothetical protein